MWTGYLWDNVTGSTCAAASDCIAEYPRLNCTGGLIDTCSVYFEGTNILSRDYINASVKWRTGLVYADFPGASLIKAIIDVNSNREATTTTVTVPTDAVYTGLPQGGSAITYTGVSGTTYGPSTTAPTAAGTYSASASFAALPQAAPAPDHRSGATMAAAPMAARSPSSPAGRETAREPGQPATGGRLLRGSPARVSGGIGPPQIRGCDDKSILATPS